MQERMYKAVGTRPRHQRLEAAPHWHMGKRSTKHHRRSCWSMEKAVVSMGESERTSLWTPVKLQRVFFRATSLHNQLFRATNSLPGKMLLFVSFQSLLLQETQLSLTNHVTRLEVSQGHKHSTIPYVRYGFLVWYSYYVRKTHLLQVFDFKYAITLKTGLKVREGHWKCHHSIQSLWVPIDVL